MWPSVADRANLEAHRELLRAMAAGEVDDASIETAYVHEQGLLVPVSGRMSVVRGPDGDPQSLLFEGQGPSADGV